MELNYTLLGSKIKEHRKINSMTQEKLAEIINVSPQHISHIENANTKLSLSCFVSICNALSVTPNEVLAFSLNTKTPHLSDEVNKIFSDVTASEMFVMLKSAEAIKNAFRAK